jgi:hypothetical protein
VPEETALGVAGADALGERRLEGGTRGPSDS